MQNLTRYIQCHPASLRYLRSRHKRTLVVVFILFLIFFMIREKASSTSSHHPLETRGMDDDDKIVSLKSHIGYLRRKIARLKPGDSVGGTISWDDPTLPMIFVVTPTYARPVQKAELTRLCHVFLMVPNLHWILVEDSKIKSTLVSNLLRDCGVPHTHLNTPTPPDWKLKTDEKSWRKPRGILQRNEALHWIRAHADPSKEGVVYFADDDNTYSLDVFEEMRYTKRVSVWPVGLVGGLMVEKPRVDLSTGHVIGWEVVWTPQRPYAVDMAGFAVNLGLFLSRPKAKFAYEVKRGYQESEFLKHLVEGLQDLEPKANMCSTVLVWHTRSEKVKLDMEKKLKEQSMPASDLGIEV